MSFDSGSRFRLPVAFGILIGLFLAGGVDGVDNPARQGVRPGQLSTPGGSGDTPVDRPLTAAGEQLLTTYPGLQVLTLGNRVHFYGKPMTQGEGPIEALETWMQLHADALGVVDAELELEWVYDVHFGKYTVYAYSQKIEGLPVEWSRSRIVALNDGPVSRVIYAAAEFVTPPAGGLPIDVLDGEEAVMSVQAGSPYGAALVHWNEPQLVILAPAFDNSLTAPIRAWKFSGHSDDLSTYQAYTFFVNAATGELAHVESDIHHVDVDGEAKGMGTPGTEPDTGGNPEVELDLPGTRASIGTNFVFADENGNFTIPHSGTDPVTVDGSLDGQFCHIENNAGGEITASDTVTPPGPAELLFNPNPNQNRVAQVNAMHHTHGIHKFWKDRQPDFTAIDIPLTTNVNLDQNCNAFFTSAGLSINFFTSGGGCVNTSYSTVVYHEYGHFIVNRLSLSQGAFGEGFADTCAILHFDTPIVGEDFFGNNNHIRNVNNANVQYPCPGTQVHFCGQILGGVWWDIKNEFENSMGSQAGLDFSRQLMTDWALITLGGIAENSAHPGTAVEVLVVADDNGDFADGVDNYEEVCGGFDDHSIPCPTLPTIVYEFPQGIPVALTPNVNETFQVNVVALDGFPQPGTGEIFISVSGGPFVSSPMTVLGPNQYEATLPALPCGTFIRFYIASDDTGGETVTSPPSAPAASYQALFTPGGILVSFEDDMETDQGWTVGGPSDTATTGIWERLDPIPTPAQPGNDNTVNGTLCWVTGNSDPDDLPGVADVDGGQTTLTSPVINMGVGQGHRVSYWRWYSNSTGANPNEDVFLVELSNNNGNTWVTAETVGPTGPGTEGGWIFSELAVEEFVIPTSQVRVRFVVSDFGNQSLVEAAVDDFQSTYILCTVSGELYTRGDCNQDGARNIPDAIALLDGLFGGGGTNFSCEDACDANDDEAYGLDDAIAILEAIFLGLPLPAPYPGCGEDTSGSTFDCEISGVCP